MFSRLLSLFRYFSAGHYCIHTHTSKLTCANFHRLGVVARAGERGSRAGNIEGTKGAKNPQQSA